MKELEEQNRLHRERGAARALQRWLSNFTASFFITWAQYVTECKGYRMRTERFRRQWMQNRMRSVLFAWNDYLATREALDSKLRALWMRQLAGWLRAPMEVWKKSTQTAIYDEVRSAIAANFFKRSLFCARWVAARDTALQRAR